jgi:negative regulator of genetic competence, sporulation and motility
VIKNGEGTFKDAPFETFGDSLDKFELPDAQTDELKKTGQKKKASNVIKAGCGVFRLESLNDFEEMCTVSSRTWGITNALYKNKEDDTYYLVLEKGRCSEEKYRSLLNLLMEYSVFDSSKEERVAFIREHYSVVIGSNAINVVKKYM